MNSCCEIVCADLKKQIDELRAELETTSRKLKRYETFRSSADINADNLMGFCGDYARCSLCSWVASEADLLGKFGRECTRCRSRYCLECADIDRDVFKDEKKQCCTQCKKRILCDCQDECVDCFAPSPGKRSLEDDDPAASTGMIAEGGNAKRAATEIKHVLETPVL